MYKLKDFVLSSPKPVYVHLADDETAKQFLTDAEKQGFVFANGEKPTERHISNFYALHSDLTLNYIGAAGRIAYQCNADSITRLDYRNCCLGEI